jgi:RimJ/RimL family protein N-acetyltransferase
MNFECVLRPLTEEDARILDEELFAEDAAGEYQWFGYKGHGHWLRQYQQDGLINEAGGRFAIRVDGKLAGFMHWSRTSWGPSATSWCWEIGITLFAPCRGKGIGSYSQERMARYLFANTRANRIQASTDPANIAEQRSLEKAGFRREGLIRGAQWRDGHWHDLIIYSILRSDVE